MPPLVVKVHNWWKRPAAPREKGIPFAIPCRCGQVVTGERKNHFQVVPRPALRGPETLKILKSQKQLLTALADLSATTWQKP